MADVTVSVAGREYRLACADGEEPHLRRLAQMIDAEAQKLAGALRTPPEEGRLMLMVALLLADRLTETEEAAAAFEEELARARAEAAAAAEAAATGPDDLFAAEEAEARLEALAARIEHLAEQVEMHGDEG